MYVYVRGKHWKRWRNTGVKMILRKLTEMEEMPEG